jgi:acetyl-CoA synthetase
MTIRPGSMGRPLPGIEAAIVRQHEHGEIEEITEPNVEGELALRPGWPSMFRGYWNDPDRYRKCFAGRFYLTGDLARRDEDGYFWFVGRKDDVIKSAGHLMRSGRSAGSRHHGLRPGAAWRRGGAEGDRLY